MPENRKLKVQNGRIKTVENEMNYYFLCGETLDLVYTIALWK